MGLSAGIIPVSMKFLVVLSFAACTFAAPTADADAEAQYLAYGHGLVGGVYAAAPVVPEVKTVEVKAAPVVSYAAGVVPAVGHYAAGVVPAAHVFAAPAVAAVKTVEVKATPVAAVAYAAPAVHVATAPVVHHVGYQVHHQVHHVPKVTVQKHTSTHTTHHVINHAPVIGAFSGVVPVAGVPVVAAAPAEPAAEADAAVVEEA